jgi:predicted ATPase
VGRAQVVDEIAGQLGQDRLVTVTGPGGAGKTRPAAEVAKQVAGRFADGVWLAELAAVQDPVQVPAAVATALGIRDLPSIAAAGGACEAVTLFADRARRVKPGSRSTIRPAGYALAFGFVAKHFLRGE